MLIPSFGDLMETSLKNITLILIPTSVTQMLRCTIVVIAAFLAWMFLKRKFYRHHIAGISAIILGIILGGLS